MGIKNNKLHWAKGKKENLQKGGSYPFLQGFSFLNVVK